MPGRGRRPSELHDDADLMPARRGRGPSVCEDHKVDDMPNGRLHLGVPAAQMASLILLYIPLSLPRGYASPPVVPRASMPCSIHSSILSAAQ
jgi:hypothetical protein